MVFIRNLFGPCWTMFSHLNQSQDWRFCFFKQSEADYSYACMVFWVLHKSQASASISWKEITIFLNWSYMQHSFKKTWPKTIQTRTHRNPALLVPVDTDSMSQRLTRLHMWPRGCFSGNTANHHSWFVAFVSEVFMCPSGQLSTSSTTNKLAQQQRV